MWLIFFLTHLSINKGKSTHPHYTVCARVCSFRIKLHVQVYVRVYAAPPVLEYVCMCVHV